MSTVESLSIAPPLLDEVLSYIQDSSSPWSFGKVENLVKQLRDVKSGAEPLAEVPDMTPEERLALERPMLRLVTEGGGHKPGEVRCIYYYDHERDQDFVTLKDWMEAAEKACANGGGDCDCKVHTYLHDGSEVTLREGMFKSEQAFYLKALEPIA